MKTFLKLFLITLFPLLQSHSFAQQSEVDDLLNKLKNSQKDTSEVNLLNDISKEFRNTDEYEKAFLYAEKAESLAKTLGYKKGLARALNGCGLVNMYWGKPEIALEFFFSSLKIREEINDKKGVASCLNNIGLVYHDIGEDPKALEYHFRSMKIEEEIGDKQGAASSLGNIGVIYDDQHEYSKALEYHLRSLKLDEEADNKRGISATLNNIGLIYKNQGDSQKGLDYFWRAINIYTEIGNKSGQATALNNIAIIYFDQGDYQKALEYNLKALKTREETGDKEGVAMSLNNLGNTYSGLGNQTVAIEFAKKGLAVSTEIKSRILIKGANEILSKIYTKTGQYEKALEHYKAFIVDRDSLLNGENTKKILQSEIKFEFEKKEQITKFVQEKKDALVLKEKEKQKGIRNIFIGGFSLVVVFLVAIFRGYRNKKKANELISLQKQEVEIQKHIIEEKQKDILDSIHYAKRIQEALLKVDQEASQHLPQNFVLFKPRDIISGDFYWSLEKLDHLYLAVADCTGHGVPGAMMSMLGIAFLNEITGTEQLLSPAEILNSLRDKVVKELGSSGQTKDGMDISLCKIGLKSGVVEWAGANNPLWFIQTQVNSNGVETKSLIEIKADKQPIGYNEVYKPFTNHSFTERNCIYYLFTDGYADQFGGPHGKKFKYRPMQEKLLGISSISLGDQKNELSSTFQIWKGNLEQVDDVCVIGVLVK